VNKIKVIVTGTPRSGTSLMMQVLKAMGCDVAGRSDPWVKANPKRDKRREDRAKSLNPKGFYEDARIVMRGIPEDKADHYAGKVVKVMFPGLGRTPMGSVDKIILCLRDPREIALSQSRLISRTEVLDKEGNVRFEGELLKIKPDRYIRVMGYMCFWANDNSVFWDKTLTVDYKSIVRSPKIILPLIADHVGKVCLDSFFKLVDKKLYRSIDTSDLQDFDLAVRIYNALLARDINQKLMDDIITWRKTKRGEALQWIDDDTEFGTWLPIGPSLYRSFKTNNNNVLTKFRMILPSLQHNCSKLCGFYQRSETETYKIVRPSDIGPIERKKVVCGKDDTLKTLEACHRCWNKK